MLEIIITGRHDNFGGEDFLDRLVAASGHNHRLLDSLGIEHRFTLAEWNPVEGRALLSDLVRDRLPWWHQCLVFDREWHQALSVNPKLVFQEFFAKNTAIRRSTADMVLTTNSDVFLSTEVAKALKGRTLDDRTVYRAVRIDVDRTINWRTCGEAALADPKVVVRVNDPLPPDYGNSAGDFLLMTKAGYMALGGFDERVRYAKIHKDGQFCVNARLEGYTFELLGPVYHIDHDGSYSNAASVGMRGSPDAPYGPEWDYAKRYRNPLSWGLTTAIHEAVDDVMVQVHHPSTHGPLLSVVDVPNSLDAAAVNARLADAKGRFIVITEDPELTVFGGRAALTTFLENTSAGLIAPAGALTTHSTLGRVRVSGAPFVMRRDLVDQLIEWPEGETDPGLAFWLREAERVEIAETGDWTTQAPAAPAINPAVQVATLTRRGTDLPAGLLEAAIAECLAAGRGLPGLVARWVESVAPDPDEACAVVGPDWATPMLIEALAASKRTLAGVFTTLATEEGTWRWGQQLRPLSELTESYALHVLAGADVSIGSRLAALGCKATFHVISAANDLNAAAADAELDGLRRAQARDLVTPRLTAVLERLPLLATLEGERGWAHRYDAAQACERAKRAATALEMYKEVMGGRGVDLALQMRAAFHTARLLIERGAFQQAAPLLAKILKHNPAHGAARKMLDAITAKDVAV